MDLIFHSKKTWSKIVAKIKLNLFEALKMHYRAKDKNSTKYWPKLPVQWIRKSLVFQSHWDFLEIVAMSIYILILWSLSNIETYTVSLYNNRNDFSVFKIGNRPRISRSEPHCPDFEHFLSPDGVDFLHSLYGCPSFFDILWRKVTIGISFGFNAIESSGS